MEAAPDIARRLASRARSGPDPEAAVRLDRFLEAARALPGGVAAAVPGPEAEAMAALLSAQSPALWRELIRHPAELARLVASPFLRREKPTACFAAECDDALRAEPDPGRALRRFCASERLRLGARELGYGAPDEVGRELAALAAICLDAALRRARAELEQSVGAPLTDDGSPCRVVAFGMGKLGGEELNFSSDIDLVFLYETDAGRVEPPAQPPGRTGRSSAGSGSAGAPPGRGARHEPPTLHEWFCRLAERTTRLLDDLTDEGRCFRVDLRLRPEGSRGPLCNSLDAAERYYEAWGRPWERQAWIKARPVAGDLDLGEEALARLRPMIWPRSGVRTAIADVTGLLRRVRAELRELDDVKSGRGGIREVEFFVQALQLLHAGRRPELRERGTLRALDRLLFAGLISERERRQLGDAYVFLRRVEHRLQLEELRQTHALPPPGAARALLARRLGLPDEARLLELLDAHRAAVSAAWATLPMEGEQGQPAPDPGAPAVAALLDPVSDRAALEQALGVLGFRDVAASADEMELLRHKPHSPFAPTATGAAARAAPRLLREAAASPDPDLALRRFVDLVVRGAPARVVWQLAGESEAAARLLASLFGTTEFLSRILVARPELCERLLTPDGAADRLDRPLVPDAAWQAGALHARLAGAADGGDEPGAGGERLDEEEARLDGLRRHRNQELLRLGLLDVSGAIDGEQLGAALTALAEALLGAALEIVEPAVFARWGRPSTSLAVIGLGRLGAGELGWSSDLDLVFVFEDEEAPVEGGPAGGSTFEVMTRLAQRLLAAMSAQLPSGRLYEVDTRLRPSGRQGTLVSSLAGLVRYHTGEAALWERQALLKARFVAGDARLGRRVEEACARLLWERPATTAPAGRSSESFAEEVRAAVARSRARQERELRPRPGRYNVKTGRGGIVDIEYLVQSLQLAHGPDRPSLRVRGTAAALEAQRAEGLLPEADHAELADSLRFLRRLENRMRIVEDRPEAELVADPAGAVQLDKLARRLGYHGERAGARLLAEFLARTSRVRALFAHHLAPRTGEARLPRGRPGSDGSSPSG